MLVYIVKDLRKKGVELIYMRKTGLNFIWEEQSLGGWVSGQCRIKLYVEYTLIFILPFKILV